MNAKKFFDFKAYMARLTRQNCFAKAVGFHPCTCSGIGHLEGILQNMRTKKAFVCTSDVAEESTVSRGGGFFSRRVFTSFIVMRFRTGDMASYDAALDTCRELKRQLHSKFLVDKDSLENELVFLNVDKMKSRDLGGQFLDSATGLYFTISMDEPVDLTYNADEWDTTSD